MAVTHGHGNPDWTRDEVVLALDLYFGCNGSIPSKSDARVVALSKLLRVFPYHANAARRESFRNPDGVVFKLQNLRQVATGKGLGNVSRTDREVWGELGNNQRRVRELATLIRVGIEIAGNAELGLPAPNEVGIGKSEVSRETIEAGTRVLQDLAERDFSKVDVLIIYLDGIQFGNHHVLAAVGVDEDGKKYVLGVRSGASENATVTTALLEDLVARGIRPDRRRLFVVDGAKALRSAIAQVFGAGNEGTALSQPQAAECRRPPAERAGRVCGGKNRHRSPLPTRKTPKGESPVDCQAANVGAPAMRRVRPH